jgi:hypothetical protein
MPPEIMAELNREYWLSRRPAKTFFKFASFMTLMLFVVLGAMIAGTLFAGEGATRAFVNHWWVQAVGFLVGVLGAPCAIGLWIGMFGHWAYRNECPKVVRFAWLLAFIFGSWLVAVPYYFLSYRKQTAARP